MGYHWWALWVVLLSAVCAVLWWWCARVQNPEVEQARSEDPDLAQEAKTASQYLRVPWSDSTSVSTLYPLGYVSPPKYTFPIPGVLIFSLEAYTVVSPLPTRAQVVEVRATEGQFRFHQSLHGIHPTYAGEGQTATEVHLEGRWRPPGQNEDELFRVELWGLQTLADGVRPGSTVAPGQTLGTAGRWGRQLVWVVRRRGKGPEGVCDPLGLVSPTRRVELSDRMHGLPPAHAVDGDLWTWYPDSYLQGRWVLEGHGSEEYGLYLGPLCLDPQRESVVSVGRGTNVRPLMYTLRKAQAARFDQSGDPTTPLEVVSTTGETFRFRYLRRPAEHAGSTEERLEFWGAHEGAHEDARWYTYTRPSYPQA